MLTYIMNHLHINLKLTMKFTLPNWSDRSLHTYQQPKTNLHRKCAANLNMKKLCFPPCTKNSCQITRVLKPWGTRGTLLLSPGKGIGNSSLTLFHTQLSDCWTETQMTSLTLEWCSETLVCSTDLQLWKQSSQNLRTTEHVILNHALLIERIL